MTPFEEGCVDSPTALKCALAAEVLRSFGMVRFVATGWSMLPTVWPGDTLVVERVHGGEVRLGDIVLAGREGRFCAHRVVATAGSHPTRQWITQGDGMPAPDAPMAESDLLGRVVYLIRAGRLLEAPAMSAVHRLVARAVRQSTFAARVLVYSQQIYLHRKRHTSPEQTVPCPS
ncbi:MAG: S24/S26 family peptidase [Candidatus Sulfotelmatobacter sp.]